MQAGFNLRYLIAGMFLAAAALVLVLAYRTYREASAFVAAAPEQTAGGGQDARLKEMEALMRQGNKEPRYQVIADRNLFSPDRRAWQAPVEQQNVASAAPIARGDVALYGTYVSGDRKYAILSLSLTAGKSKRFVLQEGESPKDDQGTPLAYQIVSIGPESVVLKDRSGTNYTIGLYVNKHSSPAQTQNAAPQVTPPPPPPPGAQPAAAGPAPAGAPVNNETATAKPAPDAASGLPADYKSLPVEEKERLVKEGKLRKINTPMGAVYRPATPQ